jgi:cytoskeletal protein CcmA (bactofilin family)
MQLKKNPRDVRFGEARPQYEEESMNDETARTDFGDDPQQITRTRRPEFEGDAASHPAVARGSSVVDAHSKFDGKYETDQDLRIEGSISGEIACRGLLMIERDATARAKIQTHDAEIRGRLEGDIVCTGRLLLTSTAVVIGTMTAGSLVVEEGASVSGKVETSTATGNAKPASASSSSRVTPINAGSSCPCPDHDAQSPGSPKLRPRLIRRSRESRPQLTGQLTGYTKKGRHSGVPFLIGLRGEIKRRCSTPCHQPPTSI